MPAAPPNLGQILFANALRVFSAGSGRGESGLKVAGRAIGARYTAKVQEDLSKSGGGGKPYKHRYNWVGQTVSSAPGTPPARQSGELHDSIGFNVTRVVGKNAGTGKFMQSGRVVVNVFSTSPYAHLHEFGLGLPKRPTWLPLLRNQELRTFIATTARLHFVAEELRAIARFKASLSTPLPPMIIGRAGALRMAAPGALR